MTLVGVWVVFFHDWHQDDLLKGRNELVGRAPALMLN